MAKQDLVKYVVENKYMDFNKNYVKVFESSFDKYASKIEKAVCKDLSGTLTKEDEEQLDDELEAMPVATEPMDDAGFDDDNDDETVNSDSEDPAPELELISIEELEDEPSIIIKFTYDGESEDEIIFDDEEKIQFYHDLLQQEEIGETDVNQIKVDILESVRKRSE